MKQRLIMGGRWLICLSLVLPSLLAGTEVIVAEDSVRDLSPQSSIEEELPVEESSEDFNNNDGDEESTSTQVEELVASESEDDDDMQVIAQQALEDYQALIESLSSEDPLSLITAFQQDPKRWQMDWNEMQAHSETEYSLSIRGMIRDQDRYFFIDDHPDALPEHVLITYDGNQVTEAMTPVVELFNQAADLLNQSPSQYADTIIEDVYLLGQVDGSQYEHMIIEHEDLSAYEDLAVETTELTTVLLATLNDWLVEEDVQAVEQVVEDELLEYFLDETTATLFSHLWDEASEEVDSQLLSRIDDLLAEEFSGAISLDFAEGRIFVVLVTPEGQATEIVLTLSDLILVTPAESEFITHDQFNDILGEDYFAKIDELSESIGHRTLYLPDDEVPALEGVEE